MKKDNYLREVLGLELNDSFSSGCLKKGREGRRFAQHRLCRSMNGIRKTTFYETIKKEFLRLKKVLAVTSS